MAIGLPSVDVYRNHVDSTELRAFLSNVFKQVNVDAYMELFKEAVEKGSAREIYQALLDGAPRTQGNFITQNWAGLQALRGERSTLAQNVAKVMDPKLKKTGYLEAAMPGRMIKVTAPMMGLSGPVMVANEQEDLIQSGWPRPYQSFQTLTYDPLQADKESLDVLSFYPGLHHCPVEKLDAFIESIHQALRPGGVFLLREHDGENQAMLDLAAVVHSCFNSATGVPLEDEEKEVRNFKSLADWKELLESKGFVDVTDQALIREGDASKNALMKFVKQAEGDSSIKVVEEWLATHSKTHYVRPKEQTHMTTVEWFNVDSCKAVGRETNWWDYRYFRDLTLLGKNLVKSTSAARKATSLKTVLGSDYMMMNGVLGTMMTVEFIAKGLINTPIQLGAWLGGKIPGGKQDPQWAEVHHEYKAWLAQYGDQLETVPFYRQSYVPAAKHYWSNLGATWKERRAERGFLDMLFDRQTLKNTLTGMAMTVDMSARALPASAINWAYGDSDDADDREIGLVVKGNPIVNEDLKLFSPEGSEFTGIISPRYKDLESLLRSFADQEIEVVQIAGHKEIQIDVLVDREQADQFGDLKLFDRSDFTGPEKKLVALKVAVKDLPGFLRDQNVHRVYDF